jgi:hypothetical protein
MLHTHILIPMKLFRVTLHNIKRHITTLKHLICHSGDMETWDIVSAAHPYCTLGCWLHRQAPSHITGAHRGWLTLRDLKLRVL